MSEPKLTTNELIIALQKKANISDEKAKDFINSYFSIIATELKNNESVSISKFGTFKKKWQKERTGRNPGTGEKIEVAARYQISFNPVSAIAEKINKPYAKLKSVVLKEPSEKVKKIAEEEKVVADEDFLQTDDSNNIINEFDELLFDINENSDDINKSENISDKNTDFEEFKIPEFENLEDDFFSFDDEFLNKKNDLQKSNTSTLETSNEKNDAQVVRLIVSAEQPQNGYVATHQAGVHEQVIERQVIKEQVIEQRTTKQIDTEGNNNMHNTETEINHRENEKIIARCWFIAGVAVVCTIIILVLLVSVILGAHNTKNIARTTEISKIEQRAIDAIEMRKLVPNTYAEIAALEYAEPRLWPYIYGANRLRFNAPDYAIKRVEAKVPPMPDRTLDRTSIEQSAIDTYRMYINEYLDRPNSARSREKRLRAVRVIADTEQIMPGFISRYELSFDIEDIQLARRYLSN